MSTLGEGEELCLRLMPPGAGIDGRADDRDDRDDDRDDDLGDDDLGDDLGAGTFREVFFLGHQCACVVFLPPRAEQAWQLLGLCC